DDSVLGSLRFVSKTEEYQVYGALIPLGVTSRKMLNSTAYKTYLAFATEAATPKKERKFKKYASFSKKKTLVAVEEPAKKPAAKRQSAIGPGSEPKVLDEQKGKSTKTSEGTGLILGVADVSKADSSKSGYESWGDSDDDDDDDDDQQGDDERTESDNNKDADLNKNKES
ncbi:hypothetical protein Tco_1581529, partial [Tanacetum coccineum]